LLPDVRWTVFNGVGYNTRSVPTLYLIATPIGNLEDVSLRALRLLKEVSLIAAEDIRTTRKLLTTYQIKTPTTSYYEHNKNQKLNYLLERLSVGDIAVVSEAGMPGLSDPGYELVCAAVERKIPVVAIPGASSITTALSVSGLPTDQFTYLGFLPRRQSQRRKFLQDAAANTRTVVTFEAPHRLRESLHDILEVMGDRLIAVCRELTKVHEEVFRGKVSQAIEHFTEPRGEFTLVLEGAAGPATPVDINIRRSLQLLAESGLGARQSVALLSSLTGVARKTLYKDWLDINKGELKDE
jgi:16S rRNA (cytidine1402-2'-O)-methyltransferase